MTPEELNRTIEFIIQSQARLAAAQEQDREERIEFQKQAMEFQAWSKDLNRQLVSVIQTQTQLLEMHSLRMDEYEKHQQRAEDAAQRRHEETLAWLQRIVDKLTDRLN